MVVGEWTGLLYTSINWGLVHAVLEVHEAKEAGKGVIGKIVSGLWMERDSSYLSSSFPSPV